MPVEYKWNGITKLSGITAKTYSIWNVWNPSGIMWNPCGIRGEGKDLWLRHTGVVEDVEEACSVGWLRHTEVVEGVEAENGDWAVAANVGGKGVGLLMFDSFAFNQTSLGINKYVSVLSNNLD